MFSSFQIFVVVILKIPFIKGKLRYVPAMRFTISFVSRTSTRITRAPAPFLHRLLEGAEGGGGCVGIVISDAAVGHTSVDILVVDPTRRDLVERAARAKEGSPLSRSRGWDEICALCS